MTSAALFKSYKARGERVFFKKRGHHYVPGPRKRICTHLFRLLT